ncbi:TPA: DUF4189 domain-containing protein [Neisseria subflava]
MKKMLFVLLGLASLNVYANGCGGEYQPATGTCRIIDSSGRQILYNVGRPQSSNNGSAQSQPRVVNIDVPSKYGAWAVNTKTGISGDTINAPSLEVAKKGAIKACEQGGRNSPCVVAAWVRNGCIAVSQGKVGKKLKTFYGIEAPGQAEMLALKKCQASGGVQCKITTPEGCSMPEF